VFPLTIYCRYHYHFKPGTQQLYKILQLAVALVVDLGLDRATNTKEKIALEVAHYKKGDSQQTRGESRSLDEERALAGCFYLSSTYVSLGQASISDSADLKNTESQQALRNETHYA
jgi:hypothetical protein